MTTFVCKECKEELIRPDGKDKVISGHCNACYPEYHAQGIIEQTIVYYFDELNDLGFEDDEYRLVFQNESTTSASAVRGEEEK